MSFHYFERNDRLARWKLAAALAIGFIGLGCQRVEAQEQSGQPEAAPQPEAASQETDSGVMWLAQMHNATGAMHEKAYASAEQNCLDALKTAGQFSPGDARLTTNLMFLAGIYQTENKTNLAEETYKAAVASREKAGGPDAPDLVTPLEKLANFYYFIEHRYDLAAPVCLRILHIVEKASPQDDGELIQRARAVGAVYRIQGQYAKAEPFYQQTLTVAGTNEDRLPDCLLSMVGFYRDWGKYDQAEALCKRALAIREKAAAANPGAEAQMNLAISLYGLGEIYRGSGSAEQAEQFYSRSLAIAEKASGPDSSELARPLAGLAATLAVRGKTNQAAALYQRAFALTESNLVAGSPVVEDVLHDYTALLDRMNRSGEANDMRQSYRWRALMYGSTHALRMNDLTEAEQLGGEALKLAGTFGPTDARLYKSQVQMAEVYRQESKLDLAEQTYKNAIASCEKNLGPRHPDLITPLESMANYYYYTKVRYDQVALLYQRILDIVRAAPVPDAFEVARRARNLADIYQLQNQNARAEDFYQQALASAESATNSPPGEKIQYLQALGDCYRIEGRCDQAEPLLKRALAIREQALGPNPGPDAELDVAVCCDYLGQIYLAWNKPGPAESSYRRSLGIVEKISGADSAELVSRLTGLATALRAQKKYEEAEGQYKRALEITQQRIGPNASQVADVLDQYAGLLADMNKPKESKAMLDSANFMRKHSEEQSN